MSSYSDLWRSLKPDSDGLVVSVVQHATTGQVLMVGYMNEAALAATFESGHVTFFSRSRQKLWEKGETSGNTLDVVALRTDCDSDALLVQATPRGPTCHTGRTSCFYVGLPNGPGDDGPAPAEGTLGQVFATILARQAGQGATNAAGKSYVKSLLDAGVPKVTEKIEEEAGELNEAMRSESDARVVSEAADLLFHMLVGIAGRGLHFRDITQVLADRMGLSGIDEKASR